MKEDNRLVTVIIPIYNSEKYLKSALDSVKVQSYQNIEILMIDDGSTDACPGICKEYEREDSRFRLICQENQGPSAARNHGIREAKGEYITFLDSDDMIHKDFIKILMHMLEEYNCDIAMTKSFPFRKEETIPWGEAEEKITYMNREQLSEQLVETGWTGLAVVMAKIYRKKLFDEIKFDESRMRCEDDTILYQLYWEAANSVLFHFPLYFYRSQREGSLTHSRFEMSWLIGIDAFKERMDFYQSRNQKLLYAKSMRTYCRRIAENYYQVQKHFPKEKSKLRELKAEMRKYSFKLLFLKGNSFKQKCSAILFAWIPNIWKSIYTKIA